MSAVLTCSPCDHQSTHRVVRDVRGDSVTERLAPLIHEIAEMVRGDEDSWCIDLLIALACPVLGLGAYDEATVDRGIAAGHLPVMVDRLVEYRSLAVSEPRLTSS